MPFTMSSMSTPLRVGRIPYLNSEPFYYGLGSEPEADALIAVELHSLPPRAMGEAARRGELDAGPFSLVDCFGLRGEFEPLGLGIAARGPVGSVLLFARRPLEALTGALIGVSDATVTSAALLRVLLAHRYEVRPRAYVHPSEARDALLLIGDEALTFPEGLPHLPYRYDLAEEWFHWQGLPFVFALWMVRRDLPPAAKDALSSLLGRQLERNGRRLEAIVRSRSDLGLAEARAVEYLAAFRYRLGPEEERAIERFEDLWRSLGEKSDVLGH